MKQDTKPNKGEWSEFYVFLRLLADGNLYAADADLNRIKDAFYPIVQILRRGKNKKDKLSYNPQNGTVVIIDIDRSTELKQVSMEEFGIHAAKLLKILQSASFSSEQAKDSIEKFADEIESSYRKEKSSSKRDITLVIHDIKTGHKPEVGFSVKSRLGGASTLFNANKTSNLLYNIEGLEKLDHTALEQLQSLKARELVKKLIGHHCNIEFESVIDKDFESNLQMVDSNFSIILSEILKLYYSGYANGIRDLTQEVSKTNPCRIKNKENSSFYEHKIKNFLTACALGMTSKKSWDGSFDASGGYIVVKEDGDVLCYHLYNWNDFQNYLFHNTSIDTPSTGRHRFGRLENNKLCLNFQIRFK